MGNSSFGNDCKDRGDNVEEIGEREKLKWCEFLVEEGWMRKIPSKSTFHVVWRGIDHSLLEQWINTSG